MHWESLGIEFSTKREDRIAYSFDASLITKLPEAIFWPKTQEEVVAIVEFCYENDVAITPRGAGTSLTGSAVPSRIVVDLSKMNSIIDLSKKIVEPGIVLNDLNNQLKKRNEFFPVTPSSYKVCTIGGMISTNASGLRAVKFGSTKDWIDYVKIVDGTGKIRKLSNEICGTEGTLGIIIEARLKTTEITREKSMDVFSFSDVNKLVEKVEEIKKEDVFVVEYLDKFCSRLIGWENKYHLIVGYGDERGEIKDLEKIMRKRECVYPLLASEGNYLIEDPKVDDCEGFLEWLERNKIPCFGHIGVGIFHPCFSETSKSLIKEMYKIVEGFGGKISGEHGYGLKKPFENKKWTKLKKRYDPKNIMNPDKLSGPKKVKVIKIDDCVGCGLCKQCPVYSIVQKETVSPRAKNVLLDSEIFHYCTLCKLCEELCPVNTKMVKRVQTTREKIPETSANKKMIENIRKYGYPMRESTDEWYCC